MRLKLALALTLLAAGSPEEIDVAVRDGRTVVRTVRAPLAEILSRFSQATGAEVVYEAARPRQLVSVVIEAASPAEAIAQLLEGQGLNYALRLDPSGRNVEMLIVSGSASPAAAPAGGARAPRAPGAPPPEESLPPEDAAPPFAPDAAEELSMPPDTPPDEVLTPVPGAPFIGTAPGGAPAVEPSRPGPEAGPATPEPGQPQPPAPASYPGPPSPPVYPGPASYPGEG